MREGLITPTLQLAGWHVLQDEAQMSSPEDPEGAGKGGIKTSTRDEVTSQSICLSLAYMELVPGDWLMPHPPVSPQCTRVTVGPRDPGLSVDPENPTHSKQTPEVLPHLRPQDHWRQRGQDTAFLLLPCPEHRSELCSGDSVEWRNQRNSPRQRGRSLASAAFHSSATERAPYGSAQLQSGRLLGARLFLSL